MIRNITSIGIVVCALLGSVVYGITDPYVREQQIGIDLYLESAALSWQTPEWFQPVNLADAPEDINHWLYTVLPYAEDRNEPIYLVIPQLGLVTPVVDIPEGTNDHARMIDGLEININSYLKGGIIQYVNSAAPGHRGKRIDFWHSNYYVTDDGRYKNIFANLMAMDPGDQLWYYVRQPGGDYELLKYNVTASYHTDPSNVAAMQWDGEGADALVFGCTHGLDGRWLVEATYIWDPRGQPLPDIYESIPFTLRNRIDRAVRKMQYLPVKIKTVQIIEWFRRFENVRGQFDENDADDAYKLLIIQYVEESLAEIYPE